MLSHYFTLRPQFRELTLQDSVPEYSHLLHSRIGLLPAFMENGQVKLQWDPLPFEEIGPLQNMHLKQRDSKYVPHWHLIYIMLTKAIFVQLNKKTTNRVQSN